MSGLLTRLRAPFWSLRKPPTAPGRLVKLVAARLAGLAPGTVAVIELLAAGEPLGMAVRRVRRAGRSPPSAARDHEVESCRRIAR
jgi:hypothetical protein